MTGRQQITAALAVYGSRTAIIFYNTYENSVQEYTLRVDENDECKWEKSKDKIKIAKQTRIFSPANSRAILDNLAYRQVIQFWTKAGYALRYSGALSADIYHLLVKGEGVYCSIGSKLQKKKLRILYECAPIAFLVEKAGGRSSNGEMSLLDVKVDGYYQKTDFIVGSKEEVERV
jgi:sedoheptulose-bisphosphatase